MCTENFDDIRSYRDDEIPAAMNRIADSEFLPEIAFYLYPNKPLDEVKSFFRSIKTIYELQHRVMVPAANCITINSITNITSNGVDLINKDKSYLFTGNHRDIVLDAFLLQILLDKYNLNTCEITFGSNLMMNQFFVDIGKSNKMFKVERSANNIREFTKNSQHLSDYMRTKIKEGTSIWIAQRNGRTKDGNDKTDQGLITMFSMSGDRNNMISNLSELNITPVAISYEIEPCGLLKAREIFLKNRDGQYTKKPTEDLNSIVTGIMQEKGNVNISICKPITREELEPYSILDKRDIIKQVEHIINERIYKNYKLFANNYIASDLLNKESRWTEYYNNEEKEIFTRILDTTLSQLCLELGESAKPELKKIFLGIYANPVRNKQNAW